MQEVLCPPCGTVIRAETEEQLIEDVKAHAQRFHGHAPSREEILNSAHPVAEDGA